MKQQFYEFLIKTKSAKRYVNNFKQNKRLGNYKLALSDYLDRTYSPSYICSPFAWDNTLEGLNYWAELDKQWVHYCLYRNEHIIDLAEMQTQEG